MDFGMSFLIPSVKSAF